MFDNVLLAALASSLLIGGAVQSCRGNATLERVDGSEPTTAVAAHVPDDADAVLGLLVEARRLVPEADRDVLLPSSVVSVRTRPDGSQVLQFPPGPPPSVLHMVYLVDPEDAAADVPVWYDADLDRVSYCLACQAEEPYSPELRGLLYLRAQFDRSSVPPSQDEVAVLVHEMQGALLMLDAADRASHGRLLVTLKAVLSDPERSEPVVPGSPWRVPSDAGWNDIDAAWPWPPRSAVEAATVDDVVHLSCALLQGKGVRQQRQAFLQIWEYTAQGC